MARHPALKDMEIKPDTVMQLNVHDDNCPFPEGEPCVCEPTIMELTIAQFVELSKQGFKNLGEMVGYGQKKH